MTDKVLKEALLLSHPYIPILFDLKRKLKPFSERVSRAGKTIDSHPTLNFNVGTGVAIASIEFGTQSDKPGPVGTLAEGLRWYRKASMSLYLHPNDPVLVPRMDDMQNGDAGLRARFKKLSELRVPINDIQKVQTAMLAFMLAAMEPEDAARFAASWETQIRLDKHTREGARKASLPP